MHIKRKVFLCLVVLFSCIWFLTGCETLKKKFTRKSKNKETQKEMIIAPRDYSAHPFENDVLYKQYFVYWKSWNQELITALGDRGGSSKKIIDCVNQSLINLKKMSDYLKEEKVKELDVYIKETQDLKDDAETAKAMSPSQLNSLRYTAERILSSVNRKFDLKKMKEYLK